MMLQKKIISELKVVGASDEKLEPLISDCC